MCSSALTKDLYLVSAVAGGWIHFPTGRRTEKRQQIFHNVAAARDKTLFQVGRGKGFYVRAEVPDQDRCYFL